MRAIDAMIMWTPDRDHWKGRPTAGQVAVTSIPAPTSLKAHPIAVGACDHDWRETDDLGRIDLMQRYFSEMIHRDGIKEDMARAALSQIDEFRGHHFAAEEPEHDDEF